MTGAVDALGEDPGEAVEDRVLPRWVPGKRFPVYIIVTSGGRRRSDLCLRPKRGIRGFGRVLITDRGVTLRVAVYRKHVSQRIRKNSQLDLFDPNDGHYEYSSIATNKRIGLRALWDFTAGRGGHEKTLAS